MESGNGVAMEEEIIVSEKTDVAEESATEAKKEENSNGDLNGDEDVSNLKEDSKKLGTKSESKTSKVPANVSKSQTSKTLKEPGNAKNIKVTKDKLNNPRSVVPISRNPRQILSQSISFPAKRANGNGLVKSLDLKSSKVHGTSSNESVHSFYGSNHPARHGSIHVDSKLANANGGGAISRRATLASLPSNKPAKSGPGDVPAKPASSSESTDSKLLAAALLSKEDDDAHSNTSATSRSTRRSSGSGFTFRLEERAEKRKEFLSKLEEKIHAKEVEKNNLQERSKENQETEIKKLRKSLTFKATPMPSFYKEPPPKVELKKIPTTRAKSPKLGRNKSSVAAANNPAEVDGFGVSSSLNQERNSLTKRTQTNSNEDNVALKKTVKKPQPKLQSKDTTKTEEKPGKSKLKAKKAENPVQDACAEKVEENLIKLTESEDACAEKVEENLIKLTKSEDAIAIVADEINPAQSGGPVPSLANTDIMPHQVSVGG